MAVKVERVNVMYSLGIRSFSVRQCKNRIL